MYEYKCKVVNVVDGDTVDVDIDLGFGITLTNERVRIVGIDAPESRTRDLAEKAHGLDAKDKVTVLLNGNTAILHSNEFKGKFGRILGDFYLVGEDRFLSEILLEEHLAVPYEDNVDIRKAMLLEARDLYNNNTKD